MSDWTQRIASILRKELSDKQEKQSAKKSLPNPGLKNNKSLAFLQEQHNFSCKMEQPFAFRQDLSSMLKYSRSGCTSSIPLKNKQKAARVSNSSKSVSDNVSALKKLRDMPRGMGGASVDSRIAAIKNMLGEKEIFKTLQMLRWPKGTICPKCKSSNIVRRDPPADAPDQRHYYVCLTCKGEGRASDFDDFTGLPVGSLHGLRQWMFCWYLIGFCSISQISKVLGLSVAEISQIVGMGSQITELPEGTALKDKMESRERQQKEKKKAFFSTRKEGVERQENETRSESKNIYKPGPKSKK